MLKSTPGSVALTKMISELNLNQLIKSPSRINEHISIYIVLIKAVEKLLQMSKCMKIYCTHAKTALRFFIFEYIFFLAKEKHAKTLSHSNM